MSNKIPSQAMIPNDLNFLTPTIIDDLIRIGKKNDGGYVLPKFILAETDVLISMGICNDWSFDEQFLSLIPHLKIHAYDHTVSRKFFIKRIAITLVKLFLGKSKPKEVIQGIRLLRAYQSFFTGNTIHFKERIHNRQDMNYDANFQKIFERIDSKKVFIKMDIEGSEYRLIDDIIKHSTKIHGMVIEFHETDPLRLIFCNAIKKLQTVYEIVHLHANNYGAICEDGLPEVLELTFIKKEMCKQKGKRVELPLPGLDYPNDPHKKDYKIKFSFSNNRIHEAETCQ